MSINKPIAILVVSLLVFTHQVNSVEEIAAESAVTKSEATTTFAEEYSVNESIKIKIENIIKQSKAKRIHYFPGPSNLIGVGLQFSNGKEMVLFATSDGDVLLSGMAISTETGLSITETSLNNLPPADYSVLLSEVAKTTKIPKTGDVNTGTFNVFFDPQCGYCKKLYMTIESLRKDGYALNVNYIPVAVMGPASENYSSALLAYEGLRESEILDQIMSSGGITVTEQDVQKGRVESSANTEIFQRSGFSAVPVIVYEHEGSVEIIQGLISREKVLAISGIEQVSLK